ncbi:MAG TPA: hypothetical protein VGY55_02220 [Pirellulales bacterium]|jgi:hypothetical protein|nr:hypothetical protein [Pirellulales bacterium]
MTFILDFPALLAESEQWREMGRDFRVDHTKLDPGLIFASIIVLVTVIAFLWFLHRLMNRREGRRLYNSPKKLFRSLCNLHELTRAERRMLARLASTDQLPQPAGVFLDPDRFDVAITLPAFRSQRTQLEQLRTKLFAGLNDAIPSHSL